MIKVAIAGSEGRMGRRIAELAQKDIDIAVVSRFDVGIEPEPEIAKCDILIEFTTPGATVSHALIAEKLGKGMVIGTTALSAKDNNVITAISKTIPIVLSPNMSMGVNLLFKMCRDVARILPKSYKITMSETHHALKKDAPSGTAKRLAVLISRQRGEQTDSIPISSIREGEVVGNHSVTFESATEKIILTHNAKTRDTFAAGAIIAAKFLYGKRNGLYSMEDVLGIV